MKGTHTPGPWKIGTLPEKRYVVVALAPPPADEQYICTIYSGLRDARLIAAAPDLLEAAKEALHTLDVQHRLYGGKFANAVREPLRAAIAKAEGRGT